MSSPPSTPPPPRRTIRRLTARLLVAGAALAVAAVAAELVVRELDPYGISYYRDTNRYVREAISVLPPDQVSSGSRIFQNKPGVDLELATFRFATNAVGLRSAEPGAELAPPGDGPRLLFLGDSVTLGWGVDDEHTWIRRLEREVGSPDQGPDPSPVQCLNAGHLQYNTVQQADLLEVLGPALAPDAVVVTFVTNDLTDDPFATYQTLMAAVAEAQAAPSGLGESLQREWAELRGWFHGLRGLVEFRRNLANEAPADVPTTELTEVPGYGEGWERVRSGLERIAATCDALGVPMIVFDHGVPRVDAVRAWCERNGRPWYDLTFTEDEWAEGLRNSPADAHANERGNELLFRKARAALIHEGLISAGGPGSDGAGR